jgi:hypothetical protein
MQTPVASIELQQQFRFSARVAVGSIKVVFLNKEPLVRFQLCR